MTEMKNFIDSGKSFKFDYKMYRARFSLHFDLIISEDEVMNFEKDKKFINKLYKKIDEIYDGYSLKRFFLKFLN